MVADPGVIQAIKDRLDIVDIVRRYVDLRPVSGRWMGSCPFHQETKGSFSVNQEKGFYYCFGCQAAGDIFDFYGQMNGLGFRETLEALALEAGVTLENRAPAPQADKKHKEREACLSMHALADTFFQRVLTREEGKPARDYIRQRGLDDETVKRFSLGYAPETWSMLQDFLAQRKFKPEQGVLAGLLSRNEKGRMYDRFRGRLIFPISDVAGKVIAFGGRIIGEGDPKYLNSSETPIYIKGEHLYGLHQARPFISRSRRAILTEGYMDVLSLSQFGFGDSVGVLGTALTPNQVKRLAGYCKRVDLVFDGDPPGRKAALKSARMILSKGLNCCVVLLPDGKDVDDLLREQGADGFQDYLDNALEGLDFCTREIAATCSAREVMTWAHEFLGDLAESSFAAYYIPRLAKGLGLSEQELRKSSGKKGYRAEAHGGGRENGSEAAQTQARTQKRSNSPTSLRDRQLLEYAVQYPDSMGALVERGLGEVLASDFAVGLWQKLLMYGHEDIFSYLNDEEKRFWAEKNLHEPSPGAEHASKWQEICRFLDSRKVAEQRMTLSRALREAQDRGDTAEATRLLGLISAELCGRADEQ